MEKGNRISTLFLDIGGVLLTDGWNRDARKKAAEQFGLDYDAMDKRHHLTFDTYEEGKITLGQYLKRVIFYEERSFSYMDFVAFMLAQSHPFDEMIGLVRHLKLRYGLKVAVISNEGRELTEYRILKFNLGEFVDFFISSCFVHLRNPDPDIYRLALDIAQVRPEEVVYLEDWPMFVQVAEVMGIKAIHHRQFQSTMIELKKWGLE